MRWLVAVAVASLFTALVILDSEAQARDCEAGFAWYGECWTAGEGRAFVAELNRHGASAVVFERRHPELAATFRQPWPPKPRLELWQKCMNGYGCAAAITHHFFGAGAAYAMRIIGCETGGTYSMRVVGDAGEISWWQLHPVHFGWIDEGRARVDPRYATRMAIRLGAGRDWSPWTCSRMV